jgi:hypothetical protein
LDRRLSDDPRPTLSVSSPTLRNLFRPRHSRGRALAEAARAAVSHRRAHTAPGVITFASTPGAAAMLARSSSRCWSQRRTARIAAWETFHGAARSADHRRRRGSGFDSQHARPRSRTMEGANECWYCRDNWKRAS